MGASHAWTRQLRKSALLTTDHEEPTPIFLRLRFYPSHPNLSQYLRGTCRSCLCREPFEVCNGVYIEGNT